MVTWAGVEAASRISDHEFATTVDGTDVTEIINLATAACDAHDIVLEGAA